MTRGYPTSAMPTLGNVPSDAIEISDTERYVFISSNADFSDNRSSLAASPSKLVKRKAAVVADLSDNRSGLAASPSKVVKRKAAVVVISDSDE